MATQVQLRRGNTTSTSTFTGAVAEVTVDTDKKTIVVHDGSTAGGIPLAKESNLTAIFVQANSAFDKANSANVLAQSAYDKANSANILAQNVFDASNSASSYANSAFNVANGAAYVANTDFTNITLSTSQTFGNSTYYPVITVTPNGRINVVATQVVSDPSAIAFAIALG